MEARPQTPPPTAAQAQLLTPPPTAHHQERLAPFLATSDPTSPTRSTPYSLTYAGREAIRPAISHSQLQNGEVSHDPRLTHRHLKIFPPGQRTEPDPSAGFSLLPPIDKGLKPDVIVPGAAKAVADSTSQDEKSPGLLGGDGPGGIRIATKSDTNPVRADGCSDISNGRLTCRCSSTTALNPQTNESS